MREVLPELLHWWSRGQPVGMGTVVATFRSAPRPPGAAMLRGPDGTAVGSVSGGCVEGAVYELAGETAAGQPPRLERFGVSDDDALAVGLTCGGIIDVFVETITPQSLPGLDRIVADVTAGRPVAVVTVVEAPPGGPQLGMHLVVRPDSVEGTLGDPELDRVTAAEARGELAQGTSTLRRFGPQGQRRRDEVGVFVTAMAPPPRLLVFGAIDFAAALARLGKFLGYHVTVCDAREVFATPRRFPDADEVVVEWPHRYLERTEVDARTVIAVITHDPKFDVPVLLRALRSPAAFVGAMGSRRTHADRLRALTEAGMTDAELSRLAAPIGLDLGARTPEETAVSIAAEIIGLRNHGSGARLSTISGDIHAAGSCVADDDSIG